LNVASLPRMNTQTSNDVRETHYISSIDDELSAQNPDPKYYSSSSSSSSSIISEMHSIVDDGHGHINKELATSIWTWENENLDPIESDPFPFASKFNYSTRDGLRLVESIAREMEQIEGTELEERHSDLIQEGVVALMKCMVIWKDENQEGESFEAVATREIRKSMGKCLRETTDGVGVMKMNIDMLKRGLKDLEEEKKGKGKTDSSKGVTNISTESEPCDQIVKPLSEALLDENPTPDEIALSEMIRNDIGDFLERTLNVEELKVIRMRFGLVEVGTSLEAIALDLGKSVSDVQDIEHRALIKLRTCFSNDYIGAYLDDDYDEEVSL
jgi:RNA polymerase sigma factor (sigma-70 family)